VPTCLRAPLSSLRLENALGREFDGQLHAEGLVVNIPGWLYSVYTAASKRPARPPDKRGGSTANLALHEMTDLQTASAGCA